MFLGVPSSFLVGPRPQLLVHMLKRCFSGASPTHSLKGWDLAVPERTTMWERLGTLSHLTSAWSSQPLGGKWGWRLRSTPRGGHWFYQPYLRNEAPYKIRSLKAWVSIHEWENISLYLDSDMFWCHVGRGYGSFEFKKPLLPPDVILCISSFGFLFESFHYNETIFLSIPFSVSSGSGYSKLSKLRAWWEPLKL